MCWLNILNTTMLNRKGIVSVIMNSINTQLRSVLVLSKKDHLAEVLLLENLHEAHAYCKGNNLTGQIGGPLIEQYIKIKYNMTKNNAHDCTGDLCYNGLNLEIKASFGGKNHKKFNFVQVRMNHICEYVLTAYYLCEENIDVNGELFVFRVTKEQMKELIVNFGGYAHGTVKKHGKITKESLEQLENDKEYALRPMYGDSCWKVLLGYRVDEI